MHRYTVLLFLVRFIESMISLIPYFIVSTFTNCAEHTQNVYADTGMGEWVVESCYVDV